MANQLVHFDELAWENIASGAREKRVETAHSVLRLVQFSPGFVETAWCQQAHIGYVVGGALTIQFRDSMLQYQEGDGLCINAGAASEHKAVVTEAVTLFLVEPKWSTRNEGCQNSQE
jgi:quercetin dioxygenase-like cupin family protein